MNFCFFLIKELLDAFIGPGFASFCFSASIDQQRYQYRPILNGRLESFHLKSCSFYFLYLNALFFLIVYFRGFELNRTVLAYIVSKYINWGVIFFLNINCFFLGFI